jgi:hypothetical protein
MYSILWRLKIGRSFGFTWLDDDSPLSFSSALPYGPMFSQLIGPSYFQVKFRISPFEGINSQKRLNFNKEYIWRSLTRLITPRPL